MPGPLGAAEATSVRCLPGRCSSRPSGRYGRSAEVRTATVRQLSDAGRRVPWRTVRYQRGPLEMHDPFEQVPPTAPQVRGPDVDGTGGSAVRPGQTGRPRAMIADRFPVERHGHPSAGHHRRDQFERGVPMRIQPIELDPIDPVAVVYHDCGLRVSIPVDVGCSEGPASLGAFDRPEHEGLGAGAELADVEPEVGLVPLSSGHGPLAEPRQKR
jgi:hypothetical protein